MANKAYRINPLIYTINGFTDILNAQELLPRILLVVFNWDLVRYLNYFEFGVSKDIGKLLKYVIREIEKCIQIRRDDIASKKAGGIIPTEPKVIYIKMIQRPYPSCLMAVRNKFNAILEETLSRYHYCYIMGLDNALSPAFFNRDNQLTSDGEIAFWREVNKQIEQFDKQVISLKPKVVVTAANEAAAAHHRNYHDHHSTHNHNHRNDNYWHYYDSYYTRKENSSSSSHRTYYK